MMRPLSLDLVLVFAALILFGCASMKRADKDAKREFTFDFEVPGKSQSELWHNARDYFAEVYGDFRSVFSVLDEENDTMIGKGLASWSTLGNDCYTAYQFVLQQKTEKPVCSTK